MAIIIFVFMLLFGGCTYHVYTPHLTVSEPIPPCTLDYSLPPIPTSLPNTIPLNAVIVYCTPDSFSPATGETWSIYMASTNLKDAQYQLTFTNSSGETLDIHYNARPDMLSHELHSTLDSLTFINVKKVYDWQAVFTFRVNHPDELMVEGGGIGMIFNGSPGPSDYTFVPMQSFVLSIREP